MNFSQKREDFFAHVFVSRSGRRFRPDLGAIVVGEEGEFLSEERRLLFFSCFLIRKDTCLGVFRSKSCWATESRSLRFIPGVSPTGQQDGFSLLFFVNSLVFLE